MPHSTLATLLTLAVYVLAAARLTRIITTDKIGEPLRAAVVDRYGADSMLSYLIFCPACVSVWTGFALAPAAVALAGISWWLLPFLALTASQITIILARKDLE
ncbi:hypothetical protein [Nocardia nova]|uniref:hypothetical protein n=1 Tax=Nocardia nova TaxID=37330 RepID=UPI001893720C|nr:hypothetical protein [Nocardia nova]MBF6277046.1 hypothetical protein [Nocardia nova]